MERKVTFLLSTGRCGSTLAQRIINASPEAVIWGEHAGFLKYIAAGYFGVLQNKKVIKNVFQKPDKYCETAWMNDFDKVSLKANFRSFVESIFSGRSSSSVACWGFKEIRYGLDSNDLSIDMLMELFPESRNLIITRHPFDTIISMIKAWNKGIINQLESNYNCKSIDQLDTLAFNYAQQWSTQNQNLIEYLSRFPNNFLWVRYEDFPEKFNTAVFDFLEIKSPDTLEDILKKKPSQVKNNSRNHLLREYLHNIQADVWKIVEKTALDLGYQPYDLNKTAKELVKS